MLRSCAERAVPYCAYRTTSQHRNPGGPGLAGSPLWTRPGVGEGQTTRTVAPHRAPSPRQIPYVTCRGSGGPEVAVDRLSALQLMHEKAEPLDDVRACRRAWTRESAAPIPRKARCSHRLAGPARSGGRAAPRRRRCSGATLCMPCCGRRPGPYRSRRSRATGRGAEPPGQGIKVPVPAIGKALIEGDPDGFLKLVADADTNLILGMHTIGPHVTELIAEGSFAKLVEGTPEELGMNVHAILPSPRSLARPRWRWTDWRFTSEAPVRQVPPISAGLGAAQQAVSAGIAQAALLAHDLRNCHPPPPGRARPLRRPAPRSRLPTVRSERISASRSAIAWGTSAGLNDSFIRRCVGYERARRWGGRSTGGCLPPRTCTPPRSIAANTTTHTTSATTPMAVGRGDHWITGGALAISTLAAGKITIGARGLAMLGGGGGSLKSVSLGLWARGHSRVVITAISRSSSFAGMNRGTRHGALGRSPGPSRGVTGNVGPLPGCGVAEEHRQRGGAPDARERPKWPVRFAGWDPSSAKGGQESERVLAGHRCEAVERRVDLRQPYHEGGAARARAWRRRRGDRSAGARRASGRRWPASAAGRAGDRRSWASACAIARRAARGERGRPGAGGCAWSSSSRGRGSARASRERGRGRGDHRSAAPPPAAHRCAHR